MSDPSKAPLHLIPFEVLHSVAYAFASGNKNREPNDWQSTKKEDTAFLSALLRHAGQAGDPSYRDPDSGLSPLAHVCANALILMWRRNQEATYARYARADERAVKDDINCVYCGVMRGGDLPDCPTQKQPHEEDGYTMPQDRCDLCNLPKKEGGHAVCCPYSHSPPPPLDNLLSRCSTVRANGCLSPVEEEILSILEDFIDKVKQ